MAERKKPTGKTGPLSFGSEGVGRRLIAFPKTKREIELFIAKLFVAGNAGMRPQIERYGSFTDLIQQPEDRPDFTAKTDRGLKWIELAEFAPLDRFGSAYDKVPGDWDAAHLRACVRELIDKKVAKGYGDEVILVIYKTHETLFVPPPILRVLRDELASAKVPFEAIYFLSPHDQESASVWEIYPGDKKDDGPAITSGQVHIGFGGFEPSGGRTVARIAPVDHDDQKRKIKQLLEKMKQMPVRYAGPWTREDLYE